MPWLSPFRADLDAFDGPRLCALGTRGGRVRMVVLRDLDEAGTLAFASDKRSRKNHTLRRQAFGEACFWVASLRTQWRLAGPIDVQTAGQRWQRVWEEMSPTARALLTWPSPDDERTGDDAFAETFHGPPTENYSLLVLRPTEIDRLDLRPHPHARRLWEQQPAGHFSGRDVNP